MPIIKSQKQSRKKIILVVFGVMLLLALLLLILEKTHIIDLYSKKTPVIAPEAKTTSTAPTAQEDFTGGDDRQVTRNEKEEGIVEDTMGTVPVVPDQTHWTASSDGAITVYTPAKNSLITSGGSLSGAASTSKVSFRLIDDVSGVIAQGTLSVTNGKFSGTFNFTTTGLNGRLDIFNTAPGGVESSNIEIPVRFR